MQNNVVATREKLGRNWLSIEVDRGYAVLSALRFMEHCTEADIAQAIKVLESGQCLKINSPGFPAEDAPGDAAAMEESQGSLFRHLKTGTR
jgi:hypothetical protein